MLQPSITMREALASSEMFGAVLPGETWAPWRVLLIAACGEELSTSEREIFEELTGRPREPGERVDELWAIIGRRGGKSRAIATLGAYLASAFDYEPILAPGERAALPIMSATQAQATKIREYLNGIFDTAPALQGLVFNATQDTLSLGNRVDLSIRSANFRTLRGATAIGAIADELAFWPSGEDSSNPDSEVLNALRPALATTGGMLAVISSPYAKRGELWQSYKTYWGPVGDEKILVAKAASRVMNPSLPEAVVKRAYERDAAAAASEYGASFRSDLESFVSPETVDATVTTGKHEAGREAGAAYVAFIDAAGGSGQDAMTMAIAHMDEERAVLDLLRGVAPPFSPEAVVAEFAAVLRLYGVTRAKSDKWGGSWVTEAFKAHGIDVEPSAKPKSDIYRELLPALNSGRVELLDHSKLVQQLCGLERRTARNGRDSIDHAPGGHDDYANAASGALIDALRGEARLVALGAYLDDAGQGVEVPTAAPDVIFAALAAGNDGQAAATIWARSQYCGYPLVLLAFEVGMISDGFLREVATLCGAWCARTNCARYTAIGDPVTVDRYDAALWVLEDPRAVFGREVSALLGHAQLPALCASHVSNGRVKLTAEALAAAQRHPLGGALDLRFVGQPTPLQLSAMIGIAGGLEGS